MKKMFLFALVTTLFITSCGQKQKGSNTLIRPVKTAQISSQSVIRKDFSGIVEAVEYVRLAFRVSGQIISLPVVEGQRVKKGQLIAAIDPRDISLQYAADKAAYETAAAQVERNKRLLGRQAISVQEYEISVANYQKAKSTYELSGNNMRDTRLTAPFEGSIEKRLVPPWPLHHHRLPVQTSSRQCFHPAPCAVQDLPLRMCRINGMRRRLPGIFSAPEQHHRFLFPLRHTFLPEAPPGGSLLRPRKPP